MVQNIIFFLFSLIILVESSYVQRHVLENENKLKLINSISHPLNVPCSTPMCNGPLAEIYCHGPILSAAWQFGLQKTCPGDRMKFTADVVVKNFKKLLYPIKRSEFEIFCEENFEASNYLELAILQDWVENPSFLKNISSLETKKLAETVHGKWKLLARKFHEDVFKNQNLYPLWPVRNPFIVPGGRFDVYFYWDTYWILKGLLISEMFETAEGIINNFADLIRNYGFIPNSGNLQLSRRTQPPLFSQMVWDYTKKTGVYRKEWLEVMDKELNYWENKRSLKFRKKTVFQYKAETDCPRPENFLADYYIGINQTNPSAIWKSIASACESGWDFSSRWMNQNSKDLSTIHTDQIIPVDLNVFMAINFQILASYHDHFEEYDISEEYRRKFDDLTLAIHDIFWDENEGCWFDFDLSINNKNENFYPSNVFPFLIQGKFEQFGNQVADYFKKTGALNYAGGVPTTLPVQSNQQWDFPNLWAPNQHLLVQSFLASNNTFLLKQANIQASKFIQVVNNGLFHPQEGTKGAIYEKYDVRSSSGSPGGGGEYLVQEGFGWTNGAVLDLIWLMRDKQILPPNSDESRFARRIAQTFLIFSWIFTGFLFLLFISKGLFSKGAVTRSDVEHRSLLDSDDNFD